MKNLISVTIVCLSCICSLYAQQMINKTNPLGGEIKGVYVKDENKVFISITLLSDTDSTMAVPISDVRNVRLTIIDVTKKTSTGAEQIETANKTLIDPNDVNGTELTKNYGFEINSTNTLALTPTFKLPKDWQSFRYQISCVVSDASNGTQITKTTAIQPMNKPANAVSVQNFNLMVGDPIWIREPSGVRNNKLLIPITSTSASFAAEVILKQGSSENKSESPILLKKGNVPTIAEVDVQSFGTSSIEIRIKPVDIDGVQIVLAGNFCTNTQNDPVCRWNPQFKDPFRINTSSDVNRLRVETNAGDTPVNFTTSSATSLDKISIKLNGNPVTPTGGGTSFNFILNNADLKDDNNLEIEGESNQNVKMLEKFRFAKITKPKLVGVPKFDIDNNGSLTVSYKLSGALTPNDESRVELSFRSNNGSAGSFSKPNCPKNSKGEFECKATLSINFSNLSDTDKKSPKIPVEFKIFAKEIQKAEELMSGVEFDFLNQTAIQKIFEDIRVRWKNNSITEAAAKQEVASNLQNVESTKVEEVWKNIKKENTDASKKKYFDFFKAVGNIALKGFGLPIQIP